MSNQAFKATWSSSGKAYDESSAEICFVLFRQINSLKNTGDRARESFFEVCDFSHSPKMYVICDTPNPFQ